MNGINLIGGAMLVSGIVTVKKGLDKSNKKNGENTNNSWLRDTIINCGLGFVGSTTAAIGLLLLCSNATVNTYKG